MAGRTTVNVSLTPELDAFLQRKVKSGRYQTTSEVVREALRLLEREEGQREDSLRQLKTKLEEAAAQAERGELVDGDKAFEELGRKIAERGRARSKARRS
jgi:antitoxin ParD1/3/4